MVFHLNTFESSFPKILGVKLHVYVYEDCRQLFSLGRYYQPLTQKDMCLPKNVLCQLWLKTVLSSWRRCFESCQGIFTTSLLYFLYIERDPSFE